MAKLVKEEGESGRLHIESRLMGESLVSKEFLKSTEAKEYFRMHPDINVLKIGGMLGFIKVDWSVVNISLLIAVLLLLSAAGWILRRMNCED